MVVGPHPPSPSAAARLCARLGAEHVQAGAEVLTVDRLPSAADRAVRLGGVAGAVAVAWLVRGADRLELVLVPGLVQRLGARSPEHRLVASAWGAALRVPRTARVHVLDPADRHQLGFRLDAAAIPGLEVVEHVADVDPGSPARSAAAVERMDSEAGAIDPEATWASFGAAVARRASADRLAGLCLRLPPPTPPLRTPNRQVVDHLRSRYGHGGEVVVQVVIGAKRLGRAALGAARRLRQLR